METEELGPDEFWVYVCRDEHGNKAAAMTKSGAKGSVEDDGWEKDNQTLLVKKFKVHMPPPEPAPPIEHVADVDLANTEGEILPREEEAA